MQGATHRAGGVTACLAGYLSLKHGVVPVGVDPLTSLVVMYPFALWGSTASDLDHHCGSVWDEVKVFGERSGHTLPSQDPVSRGISHILHLTRPLRKTVKGTALAPIVGVLDCKHRSWQTHSEFPLVGILLAMSYVGTGGATTVNGVLWQLVLTGILAGLFAHLVLDLLTPEGLPFATGLLVNKLVGRKVLPEKIKIIPHVPPTRKGEVGFFSTGGTWEKKVVYNLLHTINILLLLYLILDETNLLVLVNPFPFI